MGGDALTPPRTRILSVIDTLGMGGGEHRLLSFARTVDRDRFQHRIVTIQQADPSREAFWAMRQQYVEAGVGVSSLGDVPSPRRMRLCGAGHLVHAARRLRHRIDLLRGTMREWRADVVDAHLASAATVGVLAGAVTRTPAVMTLYSTGPLVPAPFWGLLGRVVMGLASAVVTDSEARRRDIRRWMRPARPRVLVIPNGIARPAPTRGSDEIRAMIGIPRDPRIRVIAQVASIAKHKGHLVLIEAARAVLARRPEAVFVFVGYPAQGDPGYRDVVERAVRAHGLAERIRFLSYPGPIGDVWQVVDVQVHASTFDSLPNALIEGMSLAKPIVATRVGGVAEMLEDGRSALLVPPHDARALADALGRVLDDPALAIRLGAAAHDRYRQGYHAQVMTRALEDVFAEVASRRRRHPEWSFQPQRG